jgi:hypothetical protein
LLAPAGELRRSAARTWCSCGRAASATGATPPPSAGSNEALLDQVDALHQAYQREIEDLGAFCAPWLQDIRTQAACDATHRGEWQRLVDQRSRRRDEIRDRPGIAHPSIEVSLP